MNATEQNEDKAGRAYWDTTERNRSVSMQAFSPGGGVRDFGRRMFQKAFEAAFGELAGTGQKFLELGCGGSALLPYFARQFGFEVYGIDYSQQGCELARRMCESNGVSAHIVCTDFLRAPREFLDAFDVVASFGVVEHFTSTEQTLALFARFLRPGGLMMTAIPNLDGMVGLAQKVLARDIFDKHVVLTRDALRKAHENAGLSVCQCDFLLFTNFGVVNLGPNPQWRHKLSRALLKGITGLVWVGESVVGPLPPNRISSPYLICVSRKPI